MRTKMLFLVLFSLSVNLFAQLPIDDKATIVRIKDRVENSSWEEMSEYNTYMTLSFEKDGWLYTLSYEPLNDEEYTVSPDLKSYIHIQVDKVDKRVIKLYGTKKSVKPIVWKESSLRVIDEHPYLRRRKCSFYEGNINSPPKMGKGNSSLHKLKINNSELIVMFVGAYENLGLDVSNSTELLIFFPLDFEDDGFIRYGCEITRLSKNKMVYIDNIEGNRFNFTNGSRLEITYDNKIIEYEYRNNKNEIIKYKGK